MTKKAIFIAVTLLSQMLFLRIHGVLAIPNPDIIQWGAAPEAFVISLYQGIFGRNPENNNVVQGWARQVTSSPQSRYDLFWKFVGSAEYQNSMWARHPKEYGVWWNTRMIDTTSGRRVCHCYYSSKDSHGGYMPSMQYTGVPYPAGKFSFGVSRALAKLYAAFDRETCPYYDCGYAGGGRLPAGSKCSEPYQCASGICLLGVCAQ